MLKVGLVAAKQEGCAKNGGPEGVIRCGTGHNRKECSFDPPPREERISRGSFSRLRPHGPPHSRLFEPLLCPFFLAPLSFYLFYWVLRPALRLLLSPTCTPWTCAC